MNSTSITSNISNSKFVGAFLGILVFIRTMPCYLWGAEKIIRPICAIIVLIICLANISRERWTGWIFLCLSSAYLWATIFVDHSGIITILNFLAFAFIPIIKRSLIEDAYSTFKKILVFFLFLSIINYVIFLLGINTGFAILNPLNSLKDYKYVLHPFMVTVQGGTRFMSIYDEPGVVGTLCGLILIAERMNLNKRANLVVLLAGLISLSFYFYIALLIGIVLFSKKLKHKWAYIAFFVAFVAISYNNDFMYNTLWSRFEYDPTEGKFVGDNRNGSGIDNMYDSICGTPLFFTGLGSVAIEELQGGASLKLIILKHGFVFVLLNLFGYGLLAFRQILDKKEWLLFMLFFILTLYQRPGFYSTYSIFMYTMLIYKFGDFGSVIKQ